MDINPKNVLVFKYPQPGYLCTFPETLPTCESLGGESVLIKLADLGISAYFGPKGFQRKITAQGYTAPEVLKYSGNEPLSEKVIQQQVASYMRLSVVAVCSTVPVI